MPARTSGEGARGAGAWMHSVVWSVGPAPVAMDLNGARGARTAASTNEWLGLSSRLCYL